jgi:ABC-2 type transport system ATP-binding protein
VDFAVSPGAVHGLLGPNGAGKTTLLSALFGLVLPDEGTLRLFGRTRAEAGSGWLDGVGGFVETPRFYPYLSGRRNLAVLAGRDDGDAADLVDVALDRVGLAGARRQKVRLMSADAPWARPGTGTPAATAPGPAATAPGPAA